MIKKHSGTLVYLGNRLAAYCPGANDEVPTQVSVGEAATPKRDPRTGRGTELPPDMLRVGKKSHFETIQGGPAQGATGRGHRRLIRGY